MSKSVLRRQVCSLNIISPSDSRRFEYMHKHKDRFDAVFVIQADSSYSLADAYLKIAKKMKMLHPSEIKDVVIARNVVMN